MNSAFDCRVVSSHNSTIVYVGDSKKIDEDVQLIREVKDKYKIDEYFAKVNSKKPRATHVFSSHEHETMFLKNYEKYDDKYIDRAANHKISEYCEHIAQIDDKTKKPVLYIDRRIVPDDKKMYRNMFQKIIDIRNDIILIAVIDEVKIRRYDINTPPRSVDEIIRDEKLMHKADQKIIKKFQKAPKTVKTAMKFASWYYGVNRPMIIVTLKDIPLDSLCDEDHEITHKIDDSIKLPQCAHPNCPVTFKLRRCRGCNIVKYCSDMCQRADWKNHRVQCKNTTKT